MDRFETRGEFWLSETPELRVPGSLSFDGKAARLLLDAALRNDRRPTSSDSAEIVLGDTGMGQVTVWDVTWVYSFVTRPGNRHEARGDLVQIGIHADQSTTYGDVQVELNGLDWLVARCLPLRESPTSNPSDLVSIADQPLELLSVEAEIGRIRLLRSAAIRAWSDQEFNARRVTVVALLFREPATKEKVRAVVHALVSLIEVVLQETCHATSVSATPIEWADAVRHEVARFAYRQHVELPDRELVDRAAPADLLVRPSIEDGSFGRLLGRWCDDWNAIHQVVGPLLSFQRRPISFTESRVSSAGIAVEALYRYLGKPERVYLSETVIEQNRRIRDAIRASELSPEDQRAAAGRFGEKRKVNFIDEVVAVLDQSGPVGEQLQAALPIIAEKYKDSRNGASHSKPDFSGRDGHALAAAVRLATGAALMLHLGVDRDQIVRFAKESSAVRNAKARLRDLGDRAEDHDSGKSVGAGVEHE